MSPDAQILCPSCGGAFDDAAVCPYCGNGVRFAGEGFAFRPSPLGCPVTEGDQLHQIDYHGITLDVCGGCGGGWFDLGELEQLVQNARSEAKGGQFSQPPAAGGPAPVKRERAYVKCPRCEKLMDRINWEHRSGVIVDVCRTCGVWLDGGEIVQMRSWGARTPEGPPAPLPVEKPKAPTIDPSWNHPAYTMNGGMFGSGPGMRGGRGGFAGLLADLLFSLFG